MKQHLYQTILEIMNANPGSWFSQEQIGRQTNTDGKRAQATLSRLVANDCVERTPPKNVENAPKTDGRHLYRVRHPVDSVKTRVDATRRITSRRGTKKQLALQLPLVPAEEHQRRRGRA